MARPKKRAEDKRIGRVSSEGHERVSKSQKNMAQDLDSHDLFTE